MKNYICVQIAKNMRFKDGRFVYTVGEEYFFAHNLKKLRYRRIPKMSQHELAGKLGVCRSTYADYEAGRRIPPAWFILNASNYFNVAMDDILSENMKNRKD